MTHTHKITITIEGHYEHGTAQEHASLTLHGDGGIEHMIDAYKMGLNAAGFALETAKKLDEVEF